MKNGQSRNYSHIECQVKKHYLRKGCSSIEIEPATLCKMDIKAKKNGHIIVGEIKSTKEASGSTSSWWSYWNTGSRNLKSQYDEAKLKKLSSAARGWCAVIDGQLREYCEKQGVKIGDLVIEEFIKFNKDILKALEFLKGESRIFKYDVPECDDFGIGYIIITYIIE